MIEPPGRQVLRIGSLSGILHAPGQDRQSQSIGRSSIDPERRNSANWRTWPHLVNLATGLADVSRGGIASVSVDKAASPWIRIPIPRRAPSWSSTSAQYVQLIARRVRERHAFARIVRHDITAERVRELNPLALILSGGPSSVYEPGAPHCDPAIFDLGVPILGICYGMQLACEALGAQVQANPARGEFGRAECRVLDPAEPLFHDVPRETIVWMSHGDQIQDAGRRLHPAGRDRRPARSRRSGIASGRSTGSSFIPRSRTRPMAR